MDDAGTERQLEESEAEELALKCEFRRKLAGLRWLPRRMRAGARRELYDWLRIALKAQGERKAARRHAELELRRTQVRSRHVRQRPAGPAI